MKLSATDLRNAKILEICQAAISEPFGIVLEVSDPDFCRNLIYDTIRAHPEFSSLSVHKSRSAPSELLLHNKWEI